MNQRELRGFKQFFEYEFVDGANLFGGKRKFGEIKNGSHYAVLPLSLLRFSFASAFNCSTVSTLFFRLEVFTPGLLVLLGITALLPSSFFRSLSNSFAVLN